jgi:perosamine synthetase
MKREFPRIGRTLPPAAAPLTFRDLARGFLGCWRGQAERERFEAEVRKGFGIRHCFAVSSGKTALLLILRALAQLYPGRDEVLIPAYTCYSVPSAIVRAGFKIRLCDLDQEGLDFDFGQLGQILNRPEVAARLLCIIPTHFFGIPADIARLRETIHDNSPFRIPILEDAAQAMGEENEKGKLGTLGDVGFFSLGRGKPLSLGEGGIIVTDRDDLGATLEPMVAALPSYSPVEFCRLVLLVCSLISLARPELFWLPKSLPWLRLGETIFDPSFSSRRLSCFQAGLARDWSEKLRRLQEERKRKTGIWAAVLAPMKVGCFNSTGAGMIRFPVRVREKSLRKEILAGSERAGLGIMGTYPDAITGIKALAGKIGGAEEFPRAVALAEELLTLPVHHFVTPADQQRIATLLENVHRQRQHL